MSSVCNRVDLVHSGGLNRKISVFPQDKNFFYFVYVGGISPLIPIKIDLSYNFTEFGKTWGSV